MTALRMAQLRTDKRNEIEMRMRAGTFHLLRPSLSCVLMLAAALNACTDCPAQSQGAFFGTTVVAFRTPTDICIAADSRVTSASNSLDYRPYCKIRKVGSTFFAFAGITEFYPTGFNLADLTTEVCRKPGTVFEKAQQLETLVKQSFTDIVEFYSPGNQQGVRVPSSYDIGVVICAVERGIPIMSVRKFIPIYTKSHFDYIYVDRFDCPGRTAPASGTFLSTLGHNELVKQHLADRTLFVGGVVSGIRHLVQYEIDANPQAVGPPIDILELSKTSYRWIGRKPQCFKDDE